MPSVIMPNSPGDPQECRQYAARCRELGDQTNDPLLQNAYSDLALSSNPGSTIEIICRFEIGFGSTRRRNALQFCLGARVTEAIARVN